MEEGKAEREMDELEILLDLIPKATSGSWHSENGIQKDSPTDVEQNHLPEETGDSFRRASSAFSSGKQRNTSEGTRDEKVETWVRLDGDKLGLDGGHKTHIKIRDQEKSNMLSEQSLLSSLAELSFKGEEEAIRAADSQRLDHSLLLDDQFADLLKGSLSLSPQARGILMTSNTEDIPPNCFGQFGLEMNGKHNVDFLKIDDQVQADEAVSCQPLVYQTNSPQVLLTVPRAGTKAPDVRCSQSYFSLQSPVLGMHRQEFPESHIPWLHVEEEQYSMMRKKYLQWYDLQNQRSETRNLIQASENAANVIRTWNVKKSYVNNPSCQDKIFSEESFQSDGATSRRFGHPESNLISSVLCRYHAQGFCGRGENCPFTHVQRKICPIGLANPQPALSPRDLNLVQGFGKMGEQSYPEKILMRKNGLNSVKQVSFIRESELFTNSSSNGRMISNGHFYHNAHILGSSIPFPVDGRKYWPQPLDTKDSRHDHVRLQSRKYNSVDEVTGRIYFMAKDQCGCRFLQRKMTEGNVEDIAKIFLEILGHVVELMTHPFGNYLVQKLLEVCSEDQRTQIVFAITAKAGDLITVSSNMHGSAFFPFFPI